MKSWRVRGRWLGCRYVHCSRYQTTISKPSFGFMHAHIITHHIMHLVNSTRFFIQLMTSTQAYSSGSALTSSSPSTAASPSSLSSFTGEADFLPRLPFLGAGVVSSSSPLAASATLRFLLPLLDLVAEVSSPPGFGVAVASAFHDQPHASESSYKRMPYHP